MPDHNDGRSDPEREAIRKLMDPEALEARLAVARARRAEVLAAKAAKVQQAEPGPGSKKPEVADNPVPSDRKRPLRPRPEGAPSPDLRAPGPGLPALAGGRPIRSTDGEPARPLRPVAVIHDTDRSASAPRAAMPGASGLRVVSPVVTERKRRTPVLAAAVLLAGIALGAASTLVLQFQGWQIAIVPPAADEAASTVRAQTASEPAKIATAEQPAPAPSAATPAAGPEDAAPSSVPPRTGSEGRPALANDAAADGEVASVPDALPAPGPPVRAGSRPGLAPADAVGTGDATPVAPLRPGAVPPAATAVQRPVSDDGASVPPALPQDAKTGPVALATASPATLRPSVERDAPLAPPANPAPPSQTATAAPPASQPARVAVHYPAVAPAEADLVSAELSDAGFADVTVYPASIRISSTQVRFYHESDRAAAEAVAASTSTAFDGAAVAVRSFTDAGARPPEGFLEVWLQGEGAPPVARARAAAPATRAASEDAVSRAATAARRVTQQERERQRLAGAVERLLLDQLE
ncbi:hypothetical protein [uncultured Jannaschia sp.]|uniref:hypothetical protein n=1 Tax=uncultured Jannaschia sp. TaxID=293347 RepID=UPI00262C6825|nr:hypothetical protein [uncultured Jannaschia sp.]